MSSTTRAIQRHRGLVMGLVVLAASGCSSTMHVLTHHPTAKVYLNGEPRGAGPDVPIVVDNGAKKMFSLEARASSDCKAQLLVESQQSTGLVAACIFGSAVGGMVGGAVGTAIGRSAAGADVDGSHMAPSLLSGMGLGTLLGAVLCSFRGYKAPEIVDLDISHCGSQ